MAENVEKGGEKMRYMLARWYYGKTSLSWAEIGAFLKECWWLVALFFILFIPRVSLLHKEQKQMMEYSSFCKGA